MTLGADAHHTCAGGKAGTSNREIRKLGGNSQKVVPSRSMALLTTDRVVGCRRSGDFKDRLRTRDVTRQAAAKGVAVQGHTQKALWIGRIGSMTARHVPDRG
jgi:hypothetical protein